MSNSRKKKIKAFLINGKEIKTTLFSDDMTCFLRDTNSYFQLLTLPYSNTSESINQSIIPALETLVRQIRENKNIKLKVS